MADTRAGSTFEGAIMRGSFIGGISTAALFIASTCAASAQSLPPELARDLARVFGPPVAQTRTGAGVAQIGASLMALDRQKSAICLLPNVSSKAATTGTPAKPIKTPRDVVSAWHCLALTLLAIDHIPNPGPDGTPQFYQHFGPAQASWVMAMFHLTMFEVTNAYLEPPRRRTWISQQPAGDQYADLAQGQGDEATAIASAAYTILARIYPKFDNKAVSGSYGNLTDEYNNALKDIGSSGQSREDGAKFGAQVAEAVFDLRVNDGSTTPEIGWTTGFSPNNWAPPPFQWQIDPVSKLQTALGAKWGGVTPFLLDRFDDKAQMIPNGLELKPPPVMLNFTSASDRDRKTFYNEQLDNKKINNVAFQVIDHGGDVHHEPIPKAIARNHNQLLEDYYQGIFWSYDGTAGICAPVRLYNQIADTVVRTYYHDVVPSGVPLTTDDSSDPHRAESAANLAYYYYALNAAMADAAIVAWHYKYYYQYFRPVTGINAFWGVSAPDPNAAFSHEQVNWAPSWYPLGGQNTNANSGFNPTPPFPAYPSGHSVFGGTFFSLLGKFITSGSKISFQSDELNGAQSLGSNVDAYGYRRCQAPTPPGAPANYGYDDAFCKEFKFDTFELASEANSMSRILLGVHWPADADNGKDLGNRVATEVCQKLECSISR